MLEGRLSPRQTFATCSSRLAVEEQQQNAPASAGTENAEGKLHAPRENPHAQLLLYNQTIKDLAWDVEPSRGRRLAEEGR
ncbi:hypothetical protein Trydic_g21580 [Trypoxylus dichotomus]